MASLARLGDDFAHLRDKAVAARRREQQPAVGARRDHRDDPRLGIDVDHQTQRLAERSEEHTSELQSLMRISYAVFCLKKKNKKYKNHQNIMATTTNRRQQPKT